MAKSYVKFEATKEIADKSLEALRLAKQSGSVRKGVNEVTKSVERGLATLVLIAGDVDPEEVVMHIPTLCEQKKIPMVFIPAKLDLGKAIGLNVPCAAAAIEKSGEGAAQLKEVATWSARMMGGKPEAKAEAKAEAKPEHKEHKKEVKEEKAEEKAE